MPAFLAASLALHAVAIAGLPGLLRNGEQSAVRVLEVVLAPPEPLPVAPLDDAVLPRVEPSVRSERTLPPAGKPKATVRPPRQSDMAVAQAVPLGLVPRDVPAVAESVAPSASQMESPGPSVPTETAAAKAAQLGVASPTPPVFNAAYLRNPPPRYPLVARRNGEQGTVTLKVLVNAEGVPARVSVEKTSGSAHLDNAALDTVKSWRFVPARQGAQPVEAWVLVPIVFRLEGAS